ncbi:hypothetical protein Acr_06g0011460 [Actinidia rufa]|uniref:MULE transposase domain-containing protein n=1 Tax=Actinidia rufa TaxID=165716 RepID=A0A7J0ESL1_9ERIC|nr:hypothetical protein Acr_06g0011460 [Actinidia rufa]
MLDWVRSVGRQNGIVVVIKRSANFKGDRLPKCILGCERGGNYEPPWYLSGGQSLQRNTGTRKCDCPFELRGVPIPPNCVMWSLLVKCGFHNHETAKYLDGHEYPSRLKLVEKQFVIEMAESTKPCEILNILKERDSANTTGIQSVYNAIYKHNKTNEYRITLLEVMGITSTLQTYSLMFAYLANEKFDRFTWALGTLKKLMIEKGAVMPLVLVTDRDLALMKYKEQFIVAWLNTCMHLGSNSSQRAESAHARLKLYLGDTMASLDTSFRKIHKIPRIQFTKIQKSFERSLNIPRHKQRIDCIFNEVICLISLEALKLIDQQLQYAKTASLFIDDYCDYRSTDDESRSDMTSEVLELLQGIDPSTRDNMINRIVDMIDPSHRAITAQVGYGEDNWAQAYWMDSMALGVVIASRYNLVLHTFDIYHSGCFTHLPLRSHPVPIKDRREIAVACIQGNHFVQTFLSPHYLVPPTPVWWRQHVSIKIRRWVDSYIVRINLWSKIMGGGPGAPGGEFGGDID